MIVTVPNIITFSGIIFTGLYVKEFLAEEFGNAMILLVAAFMTDVVDGHLAKFLKQTSRLGKFLDPIRDKLLFTAVVFHAVYIGAIGPMTSSGYVIFTISTELAIWFIVIWEIVYEKKWISSHFLGKMRQAVYILVFGFAIVVASIGDCFGRPALMKFYSPDLFLIPMLAAVVSLVVYFVKSFR